MKEDIDRLELRTTLNTLMQSNMTLMRSIKTDELTWLYHYSVLMGAAITFISVTQRDSLPLQIFMGALIVLTLFFQFTMLKQRRSYYNVLRTVLRIQNELGLFKSISGKSFFSIGYINKGFPRKYGPKKEKNGTDPLSSFLWRLIMIMFIQTFALFVYMKFSTLPDRCFFRWIALDLLFMAFLFWRDHKWQRNDTASIKGLSGSDDNWFPPDKSQENSEDLLAK